MPYRVLVSGNPDNDAFPTILSYSGGVDSSAILSLLKQQGRRPSAVLFSAVGDFRGFSGSTLEEFVAFAVRPDCPAGEEMPETYLHLLNVERWLQDNGFPSMTIVTYVHSKDRYAGLYGNCLANRTLPSISYGFHGCSSKVKGEVLDAWVRDYYWFAMGLTRLIGYDASPNDGRRAAKTTFKISKSKSASARKTTWEFPLIEAGWNRTRCEMECVAAFGYVPVKSACYFCAARRLPDILDLGRRYPHLARRCVEMEANAFARQKQKDRGLAGRARKGRILKNGTVKSKPCPGLWTKIWAYHGLLPYILDPRNHSDTLNFHQTVRSTHHGHIDHSPQHAARTGRTTAPRYFAVH